jgi:dephospho-CoA kinase
VWIIGLTGSIGMGKSTAAAALRRDGVPVHDADQAVHRLLAKGGAAVTAVAAAFPGVVIDGAVDRPALGRRVFGDAAALTRLEAILHPLVQREARAFLARARRQRRRLAVLDVPLLFETGGERRCDAVIVVSAPRAVQQARVLARPGMTPARLAAIEARQMPDAEKRRRADWVVPTGLDRRTALHALRRARKLVRQDRSRAHRPPRKRHRNA